MKSAWNNRVLVTLILMTTIACSTQERKLELSNDEYQQIKVLIGNGHADEGILRLQALVNKFPENPEYRAFLKQQEDLQIATLLRQGDSFRAQSLWTEAKNIYDRVILLDRKNQRANDGIASIQTSQKHHAMFIKAHHAYEQDDVDDAQTLIRNILAEDSKNVEARSLYAEIEQKRIDKIIAVPRIKSAFNKPVTLEFKDVPVKSIFEFISKAAGINFIYDQEMRTDQPVSIFVRDTTIQDAIDALLTSNQMGKKTLNNNTLLIYPLSRSQEYQESFVRSFYLGNTDAKRIMALIKAVVKTKDIYIDEKLNTLVMKDTADAIRIAEKLIVSQDLAEPEVVLEVEVLEINRRSLEAIGIRYPNQVSLGVQGRDTVNGITTLTPSQLTVKELKNFNSSLGVFSISDPVLALNLLQQDTDTNLLANPHIRVKNREKAKIHVGDRIPVLTSIANSVGFVSQSVSYIEVGVKLDVEPTILLNDEVSIKIALEVSNQTDKITTSSGTVTYTIGTRNANTILRLKDGETQVLAGLLRDDEQKVTTKVPGLGSLPLIGKLFSDRNNDKSKKEIALLITPHIVSNIVPADAIYTTFPAGVERNNVSLKAGPGRVTEPVMSQPTQLQQPASPSQTDLEKSDREFANSVMKPVDEAGSSVSTEDVR